MVASGHSWSSVKGYTLSEIGVFFKTIILEKRQVNATTLSNIWMGNNLSYKDFQKVMTSFGIKEQKKEQATVAEVNKDWNRLKTFMAGRK